MTNQLVCNTLDSSLFTIL